MKQQVLFFFFTLMLTGISVSAQTGGGRIAGVVIDNAGEEPLPGATIFIEELKKGIVTDGHTTRKPASSRWVKREGKKSSSA